MHLTCRRRLPLAKVQEVPAELLQEVCDEKLMPIWAFCLTLLLEVGVWVGIYWRDYSYSPNIEIGHYFSFQTITDLSAWRLPANRRSWWNPFRAIVAISFIFFEVSVLINGAEKFGPLVIVRLALCTLRLIHALTCMKVYGPSIRQWTALPANVRFHLEHISAVPLLLVAWACVGWFCPYVFILMHYNYGELRLDGPLTALQDTYVVTVVLKSFMMDVLNASPLQAGMSEILSCMLFSAQYPVIFDMYWLPPLRMGHLLAEVLFGTIGLCYLFLDLRLVFDSSMVCSVEP